MAELGLLRAQVVDVAVARRHLEGNALGHLNAVNLKSADLARIIGKQRDLLQAEIAQDLRADTVIAEIFLETELEIGLHRVAALILQRVSFDLVREADTPAFLVHVDQHATAALADQTQRLANLIAAVAALGTEHVSSETFGMHAHEHRPAAGYFALDQRHMFQTVDLVAVDDGAVHAAMNGWKFFFGDA